MAKAYDRVRWEFLLKVLRRMGFTEKWLSLVERCINSCWFSVLINGTPAGFFKSSRGLRQGDPLSPSLFVLAADYLSRHLDNLILGRRETKFSTAFNGMGVSHLAYADDILVFTQASSLAIRELKNCLSHYCAASGQRINEGKSHFFVDEKHSRWAAMIKEEGGFDQGEFPFVYLGVPIFKGRKKTNLFSFLRDKISARIHSWSHKFLSFGGRLTLIKSTLGAIPLHIFQVLEPTKEAVKQMESLIAKFFWGSLNDKKATHWISWDQICHPYNEGGLGVRRFGEMIEAFSSKLWIRFREQNSLWAKFILRKYCQKLPAASSPFRKGYSLIWRRMTSARESDHKNIRWILGKGDISFWEDIWWDDQPIKELVNPGMRLPAKMVKEFWQDRKWNVPLLHATLEPLGVPRRVVTEITEIPIDEGGADIIRWVGADHGEFSTSSAWELCRHRLPHTPIFDIIWNGALSPSISIFVWRLLANRIPVDTKLQWRNISLASKCRCCKSPAIETKEHLFLQSEIAREVWKRVGIWFPNMPGWNRAPSNIEARITFWQRRMGQTAHDHACTVIPCMVLWFLWAERNSFIHKGTHYCVEGVLNRIKTHTQNLITAGKMRRLQWAGCDNLEGFDKSTWRENPRMKIKTIRWLPPDTGWIKLNTNGTSHVLPLSAGAGGIIRDSKGEIIRGFAMKTTGLSRVEGELHALRKGIEIACELSSNVWIELENQEIVGLLQKNLSGPAKCRHVVTTIKNILRQVSFKVSNISKEGNKAAAALALQGRSEDEFKDYDRTSAPTMIQALARMDQLGLPNFSF